VCCSVSTAANICYFWLGGSICRRLPLVFRVELTVEFELITSLHTRRTRPRAWLGIFDRLWLINSNVKHYRGDAGSNMRRQLEGPRWVDRLAHWVTGGEEDR